jgi:hypothetical protein
VIRHFINYFILRSNININIIDVSDEPDEVKKVILTSILISI